MPTTGPDPVARHSLSGMVVASQIPESSGRPLRVLNPEGQHTFGTPLMRVVTLLVTLCTTIILARVAVAGESLSSLNAVLDIDFLMEHAASEGLIAGGVVLVGTRTGTLVERAYGRMSGDPAAPAMGIDTVFDVASLTKVVATTSAIMALAEAGTLTLTDPVALWFPELAGDDKAGLQLYHLLTHTSGFDEMLLAPPDPLGCAVSTCATRQIREEVGRSFRYSDINFVLLGEVVKRASGVPLDRYVESHFFVPLKMSATTFTPPPGWLPRISATLLPDGSMLAGTPQDVNARLLGGVAGHAGLFSTAADLGRFCRMLMNGGELDGVRVLQQRTVEIMTNPSVVRDGKGIRGLGWDIGSAYAAPRGHGFSARSFGHTGYTGTSLWIDRDAGLFVILLTARVDYRRVGEFNQLRRDLSTMAAVLLSVSPSLLPRAGAF